MRICVCVYAYVHYKIVHFCFRRSVVDQFARVCVCVVCLYMPSFKTYGDIQSQISDASIHEEAYVQIKHAHTHRFLNECIFYMRGLCCFFVFVVVLVKK